MSSKVTFAESLWGDVFVAGNNLIGCARDSEHFVMIDYYSFDGKDAHHMFTQHLEFDERILFVRAAKNMLSHVLVMGQENESGKFAIKSIGGNYPNPNKITYGTHVCDLLPVGSGFIYAVQISETEYYDSQFESNRPIPQQIWGTSQGMIQYFASGPIWADLYRNVIPQMLFPFTEGDYHVGEGDTDPAHIEAHRESDNAYMNIYEGEAVRPRACYDKEGNVFAIASSGKNGVTFHFYNLPLEGEVACTPVVPPQNIIQDSTNAIRKFCQDYRVPANTTDPVNFPPGSAPYKNDEIHENGLFLSDGILYFMMSDTGRWAQVLMNPDDKRDWNTKRQAADAALFEYMKARCGDPSAQTSIDKLSGNVDVDE